MTSRNASFYEAGLSGAFLAPIKWLCVTFLALAGLLLAAWVVDWIFVFHVWPDGLARLERILRDDLSRSAELGGSFGLSIAANGANVLYGVVFKFTGMHDMGIRFAQGASLSIPDTIARNTYWEHFENIRLAMVATQLFGIRVATMTMCLPVLLLSYGVSTADGLTQRAIRRAAGGRESGGLYHRAKHLQLALVAAFIAASLVTPISRDPRWLWISTAFALAVLSRVQWTYYKKHL